MKEMEESEANEEKPGFTFYTSYTLFTSSV